MQCIMDHEIFKYYFKKFENSDSNENLYIVYIAYRLHMGYFKTISGSK